MRVFAALADGDGRGLGTGHGGAVRHAVAHGRMTDGLGVAGRVLARGRIDDQGHVAVDHAVHDIGTAFVDLEHFFHFQTALAQVAGRAARGQQVEAQVGEHGRHFGQDGLVAVIDRDEDIAALRQMGLSVLLLTGDHRRTAEAIAKEVGIPRVIPEVLPQQKEAVIRSLQQKGEVVAMVGDGINDAPALVRADIGIAIGAGTDIAIDSADIVLMHSDPADIPAALQLSRSVLRNIKQNLFWAFLYNSIGIPIAAGVFYSLLGWKLSPMLASAAMSLSSVCVVSNALRLRGWKPKLPAADALPPVTEVECTLLPQGAAPAAPQSLVLHIDGMMCDHCVGRVKSALESLPGVTAEVSLAKNTAALTITVPHSPEELTAAVEAAGYKVTRIE